MCDKCLLLTPLHTPWGPSTDTLKTLGDRCGMLTLYKTAWKHKSQHTSQQKRRDKPETRRAHMQETYGRRRGAGPPQLWKYKGQTHHRDP